MGKRGKLIGFLVAVFVTTLPVMVYANFGNDIKLSASDYISSADGFGESVSISGNAIIVGASGVADYGIVSGAAYIYELDAGTGNWVEQKLLASDSASGDYFGKSASISGDTVIIGAHGNDDLGSMSGSAYIFVRDSGTGVWAQQKKLLASDGVTFDFFGRSVSISGDTVIVGAAYDDDNGDSSGSAYIFVRDSGTGVWTEQQKLTAADGVAEDYFGYSVAINGDTAIVGAYNDYDANGNYVGSAYIFVRDTGTGIWTQQQKIVASGVVNGGFFGLSVSIDTDTAIVGATADVSNNITSGSSYVFVRDSGTGIWSQQQKLVASDGAANDGLGTSVAISGDVAFIGAKSVDDKGTNSGAAYVYVRDSTTGIWTQQQKLLPFDGAAYDVYGWSVAISGSTIVAGAPLNEQGFAYVYTDTGSGTTPDITVTDSVAPVDDLAIAFGDVTELSTADQTVTVTNDGNADLTIANIAVADSLVAPFSITTDNCSSQVLTPAANCTLTVQFSPASTGAFNDSFDIPSDDPNENPVTVSVDGTGTAIPVPDITVTDTVLPVDDLAMDYGSISQATFQDKPVTIVNDGNADLVIGNIANIDVLILPFSILNDSCSSQTIAPAGNCSITVRFEPSSAAVFSDSFDIPSNDADEASVIFNLAGTGVVSTIPDIAVSDSVLPADNLQIDFASLLQGTATDETITITNNGSADLNIGAIASANVLAAPFSILNDNCSGQTVAVAANCTFTVRFAPTAAITSNDSFDIPSDDPDENPVIINLSGTGTPILAPEITVDLQLAFGDVVEVTSSEKTLTITNDGTVVLNIGNIAQNDILVTPFKILSDNCSGAIVQPGASCSLTLIFSPGSTDAFNDSFDIPSDDADETVVTVNVSGTGVSLQEAASNNGLFGIGKFNPWFLLTLLISFGSVRFNRRLHQDA